MSKGPVVGQLAVPSCVSDLQTAHVWGSLEMRVGLGGVSDQG